MGAKKRVPKVGAIEFDALSFRQRGGTAPKLVMFVASAGDILRFSKADELTATTKGPQREQKEARVQAIAKFLEADKANTIPTAVILAFGSGAASFTPGASNEVGLLRVRSGNDRAAAIVDGQHRLTGIKEADPTIKVAVVALLDADAVEKAFQFLVINNKASKVAASHTKALLAKYKGTSLASRLMSARLAFDVEGINDVDLVNSDSDSPFFKTIDWAMTPKESRMIQATAIELSLDYLGGLGIPEYEDRDVRRSVFLTIWRTIRNDWKALWKKNCRLVSKVGIVCLTRFISDRITNWADNDELDIEVTDLEVIATQTRKIIQHMDLKFWTTPWAEKAQGGFDTNQGRERVYDSIVQLYRNGKRQVAWYTDIEIVDRALAK